MYSYSIHYNVIFDGKRVVLPFPPSWPSWWPSPVLWPALHRWGSLTKDDNTTLAVNKLKVSPQNKHTTCKAVKVGTAVLLYLINRAILVYFYLSTFSFTNSPVLHKSFFFFIVMHDNILNLIFRSLISEYFLNNFLVKFPGENFITLY